MEELDLESQVEGSDRLGEDGVVRWRLLFGRLRCGVRTQGLHRKGNSAVRIPRKEEGGF